MLAPARYLAKPKLDFSNKTVVYRGIEKAGYCFSCLRGQEAKFSYTTISKFSTIIAAKTQCPMYRLYCLKSNSFSSFYRLKA